jgi:hypothetical protein
MSWSIGEQNFQGYGNRGKRSLGATTQFPAPDDEGYHQDVRAGAPKPRFFGRMPPKGGAQLSKSRCRLLARLAARNRIKIQTVTRVSDVGTFVNPMRLTKAHRVHLVG